MDRNYLQSGYDVHNDVHTQESTELYNKNWENLNFLTINNSSTWRSQQWQSTWLTQPITLTLKAPQNWGWQQDNTDRLVKEAIKIQLHLTILTETKGST